MLYINVSVWACFTNHYYIVLCNVHCHGKLVYASLPLTSDLFASSPTNRFLSSLKQPCKPMVSLISMYLIKMCVLVVIISSEITLVCCGANVCYRFSSVSRIFNRAIYEYEKLLLLHLQDLLLDPTCSTFVLDLLHMCSR